MAAISRSSSNGFSMKSSAPRFIASTASGTSPWPVMSTTGQRTLSRAPPRQVEPAHSRHTNVRHRQTRPRSRWGPQKSLRRTRRRIVSKPADPQQQFQRIAHRLVVVDDIYEPLVAHGAPSPRNGSVKLNVAPPPSLFSARISPPCASTMPRLIDRPTPSPCDLVVKNGSNNRDKASGAMPDAGVGDGDLEHAPPTSRLVHSQIRGAARSIASSAVAQQIDQHLFDLHSVDEYGVMRGIEIVFERHALFRARRPGPARSPPPPAWRGSRSAAPRRGAKRSRAGGE